MVRLAVRPWSLALIAAAGLAAASFGMRTPADAARGGDALTSLPPAYELIVFEAKGCIYCKLFRRDVAPTYVDSARAREAPLVFANAGEAEQRVPGLKRPLTIVPTAVLARDGREIARIEGYTGPEPFFQIMSRLFAGLTPD